jgi:uncharacterized protein YprB with RNaseH-like and TPR domain
MIRLTVYSETALSQMNLRQFSDSVEYFDPDALYLQSNGFRYQFEQAIPHDCPVITPRGQSNVSQVFARNGVELVVVRSTDGLAELREQEGKRETGDAADIFVLSDLLEVDIDLTALETRLDGREAYEEALQPESIEGEYTQLVTTANPSYRASWGELEVQGVLPGANQQSGGAVEVAHLTLQSDGVVTTTTRDVSKFGLRALQQVGRSRAETLREAGVESPADLVDAEFHAVQELSGFGRPTAETVRESAEAFVDGEVRHQGDDSLPNAEPVFIDIETDGLNPTMVWLIGVLDREGGESYMSFLAKDPQDRGEAVGAFMSWFTANASHRPVVAYNGYDFDFPVLEEHIQEYCPQYLDDWEDAWTFDPYYWAVSQGNAILPGRTNKLEDVAGGLGWDGFETGLSGGTVARLFQAYMAAPSPETELDWDRHTRYCEDDVRSLAHVFDAISEAPRRATDSDPDGGTGSVDADDTAQGRLTDF